MIYHTNSVVCMSRGSMPQPVKEFADIIAAGNRFGAQSPNRRPIRSPNLRLNLRLNRRPNRISS